MSESMKAGYVHFAGHNSDDVEAYFAEPTDGAAPSRGGVVVIHHLPGFDRTMKEIARRVAELGYNAIEPNLYWREAPGLPPDAAAEIARANGGAPDARLVGDVAGAAAYLRSLPSSNGKVGVIGFCSGGRQSVLSACSLELDAAVDCYGGAAIRGMPEDSPMKWPGLGPMIPSLSCPLLGLFGNDDSFPSPEEVTEFETILTDNDKPYEFHRYDGAGHAFLSSDRTSYRVEAANDAWVRIEDFYGRHLRTG